jgi:hypothetical protein
MQKSVTFGACAAMVFAGLTAATPGTTAWADDCLAAPSHTASPGTHWVARPDRTANRKCWYLVDAAGHPAPEDDSIGTRFSRWLTGDAPPDQHATPPARPDDAKPRAPRQPDTQASHKPPAPHPVADPPGNPADSDALFKQFLRWKEHQPPQKQSEKTQQ